MITIEQIQATGVVPESFHNIAPGCAIFYAPKDGVSSSTKKLVLDLFDKCKTQREGFALKIDVETTSNQFLQNTIVTKRLNLGSLYRYNLLIGCVNCKESVDAFVSEFFNLASRDDEALKLINKKQSKPCYDFFDEPSFAPSGMIQMIVMKPTDEEENDYEDVMEKTPEQIADENEILQKVLAYADKYKKDVPIEYLRPLAAGTYILTEDDNDCRLIFSEKREFILKAGTTVELKMTKFQKAFYLFMLAHPKGVEAKRLSEYREDLIGYYDLVLKNGNDDNIDKTIDNLIELKDNGSSFEMPALKQLCSKLNKQLAVSILNRTSQKPFLIQNTNGILHVDLDRKFFEWELKKVKFVIND